MRGIKSSSVRSDRQKKVTKVRNHRRKPSLFTQVIFSFELQASCSCFFSGSFQHGQIFLLPATGPGTLTQHRIWHEGNDLGSDGSFKEVFPSPSVCLHSDQRQSRHSKQADTPARVPFHHATLMMSQTPAEVGANESQCIWKFNTYWKEVSLTPLTK